MNDSYQIKSLDDLLKKYFQQYPFQKQLTNAMVRSVWKQMMSMAICNRTEKIYVFQNKVFIKINSPVLRNELQFGKHKILAYFKKYMPSISLQDVVIL